MSQIDVDYFFQELDGIELFEEVVNEKHKDAVVMRFVDDANANGIAITSPKKVFEARNENNPVVTERLFLIVADGYYQLTAIVKKRQDDLALNKKVFDIKANEHFKNDMALIVGKTTGKTIFDELKATA